MIAYKVTSFQWCVCNAILLDRKTRNLGMMSMSMRQQRLADEIRDVLAECFQGGLMSDPRLEQVTITGVKLSPDLQLASVYFRVYSDDVVNDASQGLTAASGFLRKELARRLTVRRVPNLRFFYDESIEKASRIEDLLRKL